MLDSQERIRSAIFQVGLKLCWKRWRPLEQN